MNMGIMNAYGESTPKRLQMRNAIRQSAAHKYSKSKGISGTRFAYSENFTEKQLYMNVIKET